MFVLRVGDLLCSVFVRGYGTAEPAKPFADELYHTRQLPASSNLLPYQTGQKRKCQTSVVELMREEHPQQEIRSGASLHSNCSGLQAVFLAAPSLTWENKGCVPHATSGRVCSSACGGGSPAVVPAQLSRLGFLSLGVGWDGREQGEGGFSTGASPPVIKSGHS